MTPILLTCIYFDNGFLYFLGILHFSKYPNFSAVEHLLLRYLATTSEELRSILSLVLLLGTCFHYYSSHPSLSKEKCESVYMQYQAKATRLLQQAKLFMKSLHDIILCPHWHFSHIQMQQHNPLSETVLESSSWHVKKWKHYKGSRSHELIAYTEHLPLNLGN